MSPPPVTDEFSDIRRAACVQLLLKDVMVSTRSLVLLIMLVVGLCIAFDKNQLKKGRKSAGYEKHPISRRVLRFERSAEFPQPAELPFPLLDFAKIMPEIPVKYKPSHALPDTDYQPELEF